MVDILNGLNPRGKARFIADAILHYVNCGNVAEAEHPNQSIEASVEMVVRRMFQEIETNGMYSLPSSTQSKRGDTSMLLSSESSNVINFDDIDYEKSMEVLSGDGYNAIAEALEGFRRK